MIHLSPFLLSPSPLSLLSLFCLHSHCIHQILESVHHIHQHDIVHRDLKVSICRGASAPPSPLPSPPHFLSSSRPLLLSLAFLHCLSHVLSVSRWSCVGVCVLSLVWFSVNGFHLFIYLSVYYFFWLEDLGLPHPPHHPLHQPSLPPLINHFFRQPHSWSSCCTDWKARSIDEWALHTHVHTYSCRENISVLQLLLNACTRVCVYT